MVRRPRRRWLVVAPGQRPLDGPYLLRSTAAVEARGWRAFGVAAYVIRLP